MSQPLIVKFKATKKTNDKELSAAAKKMRSQIDNSIPTTTTENISVVQPKILPWRHKDDSIPLYLALFKLVWMFEIYFAPKNKVR